MMSQTIDGHVARKRFGQNFLADTHIIERIITAIHPQASDCMVEIGPGLGALTHHLLPHLNRLVALELDRDLAQRLRIETLVEGKLTLIEANALKFDIASLYDDRPMRIVGNLPYNISTPLIFHLLGHAHRILDMHFMLQKEVVERMVATPGDRAYGRLSVMLQYRCQVDLLFLVPPSAFRPPPKVESAIVRLAPYAHLPYPCSHEARLHQVVTQAFGQRRKTLRNALRDEVPDHAWVELNLSATARPETLSVADYVRLVNWLEQHGTA